MIVFNLNPGKIMFTRISREMTNATFVCTHHSGQGVWLGNHWL